MPAKVFYTWQLIYYRMRANDYFSVLFIEVINFN